MTRLFQARQAVQASVLALMYLQSFPAKADELGTVVIEGKCTGCGGGGLGFDPSGRSLSGGDLFLSNTMDADGGGGGEPIFKKCGRGEGMAQKRKGGAMRSQ